MSRTRTHRPAPLLAVLFAASSLLLVACESRHDEERPGEPPLQGSHPVADTLYAHATHEALPRRG